MSDLVDSDVNENSETARTPLSDTSLYNEPLYADSIERCLVLDLNSIYDLILGMVWLERHEPWIVEGSRP